MEKNAVPGKNVSNFFFLCSRKKVPEKINEIFILLFYFKKILL